MSTASPAGAAGLLEAPAVPRPPARAGRHRHRSATSRVRRAAVLALAVLCVSAAALDGLWWRAAREHRALDEARASALVAATSAAQKVLSFDYRTMAADVARAKATATGPFLAEYTKTAATLAKEVGPAKAIVQATAQSGSVVSATRHRVDVLLFVDQASVRQQGGTSSPVTRLDQARVRMTMVERHGRWLVSSLASL